MEAKIQKQIIDYFSFFEEFHNSSKTCLKDCQKCAVVINKLVVRCRKIKEAKVAGTPLVEFEDIQNKLVASIHNLISEEICEIRNHLLKIEDQFDQLCSKHNSLQQSCKELDFNEQTPLINGTPFQPRLSQLLEFSEDILTFGSQISSLIESSLNVLTYKGLNTESLTENFKIPTNWQPRILEILSYTSFCSENVI